MAKYILAFVMFIMVLIVSVGPFVIVATGFYATYMHSIWGIVSVFVGCILLRLIKPISIITGKDYKVF